MPAEPTEEMILAVWSVDWSMPNIYGEFSKDSQFDTAAQIYRAMLSASPAAPQAPQDAEKGERG